MITMAFHVIWTNALSDDTEILMAIQVSVATEASGPN